MRSFLFLYTIIFWSHSANAQTIQAISRTILSAQVEETSGLLELSGRLITHNDSGDGPFLYEVDSLSGSVLRKVYVQNAGSNDWEDITADNQFIYIGDFGNNNGTRTNLAIYKIDRTLYLFNDTVTAEIISFNYSEQTSFNSTPLTPFDAEALVSAGDSLYLFTKDKSSFTSSVYVVPKNAGNYTLSKRAILPTSGLVTGGCFNGASNKIVLCGYSFNSVFIYEILFSNGQSFTSFPQNAFSLNVSGPQQVEAIERIDANTYYISSEKDNGMPAQLSEFKLSSNLNLPDSYTSEVIIFPNPSANFIEFSTPAATKIEILNGSGKMLKEVKYQNGIDISDLSPGLYFLKWDGLYGGQHFERLVIVR